MKIYQLSVTNQNVIIMGKAVSKLGTASVNQLIVKNFITYHTLDLNFIEISGFNLKDKVTDEFYWTYITTYVFKDYWQDLVS